MEESGFQWESELWTQFRDSRSCPQSHSHFTFNMYAQHKGATNAGKGEVSVITFTAEFRKELKEATGPIIVDWTASW